MYTHDTVDLTVLRQRAYNLRWAEQPEGVIPLTAADSDFPCAPEIVQAVTDYARSGYFNYTPPRGFARLREGLARSLFERKGEPVDPSLILPLDSAARCMQAACQAVLRPGDEAIVCDPVDFLFRTNMEAAGAKVVACPARVVDGKLDLSDLEQYITPRTRMFGLCNPHNPLGLCYPREALEHLLALSEKYGFYILNDEIWSDIIYPEARYTSLLSLGVERNARTISVYGFSKSFAIAGLRVGCAYAADPALFERIVQASMVETTVGGCASLSQVAATACVEECWYAVDALVRHITENRDYALARIGAMPGITAYRPEATFVLYCDISALGLPAAQFTEWLRENHGVAIVPGGARFFGPASEGHVRICLNTSRPLLAQGLDRLEAGLKELTGRRPGQ